MLRNKIVIGLLCLFLSAFAQGKENLLTVTGLITKYTDSHTKSYSFSERDIFALPQHTIETSTSWTEKSTFVGPRLSDVLSKVGATTSYVEVRALDEYSYTISIKEATRYGAILAHTMNGQRLQVSNFGPLFLIYPRDQYPKELRTPVAEAKFVWQMRELVVK